jgi:hypothetical protein
MVVLRVASQVAQWQHGERTDVPYLLHVVPGRTPPKGRQRAQNNYDGDAHQQPEAKCARGWQCEIIRKIALLDFGDEPVALRMYSFEVTWRGRVILQSLAQPGHRLTERGFADYRVAPHRVHQFLPRHEPITVGNQVNEEFQDNRFEVDLIVVPAELPRIRIYDEVIETVSMVMAHDLTADRNTRSDSSISRLLLADNTYETGRETNRNRFDPISSRLRQTIVKHWYGDLYTLPLRFKYLLNQQRRTR